MKGLCIGEGIGLASTPSVFQSECLWFVLTHVPAPPGWCEGTQGLAEAVNGMWTL